MQIQKYFAIAVLLTLAISYKKKPVETDSIFKFRNYISYTTSGLVSVIEPVKISLTEAVAGWKTNEEIDPDLIELHPYVQGKLQALNNHTIIFTPDEPLEPSTEYTVKIKLAKIYNV